MRRARKARGRRNTPGISSRSNALGADAAVAECRTCLCAGPKEGFDFLGCHVQERMSGRLWKEYGRGRYYLPRWPTRSAVDKAHRRVHELTDRRLDGVKDVRVSIRVLNPLLRGWGGYFRTGNAEVRFKRMDSHVHRRLRRFMSRRKGRQVKAGEAEPWNQDFFWNLGLFRLRQTVRYPEAA